MKNNFISQKKAFPSIFGPAEKASLALTAATEQQSVLDLSSSTGYNIWSINGAGSVFYFGFAALQLNASHLNKKC